MYKLLLGVALSCLVLAVACVAASADPVVSYDYSNFVTAPTENAPGHGFAYDSLCQSPGTDDQGNTYYDWWYSFYLENDSMDHKIISWTWSYGGATGPVMPGVHEWINVTEGSADFPLDQAPSADLMYSKHRAEDFNDFDAKVTAVSTITWDDQYSEQVNIYIPSSAPTSMTITPEPGSLLAIASGLVGLIGCVRRRRA